MLDAELPLDNFPTSRIDVLDTLLRPTESQLSCFDRVLFPYSAPSKLNIKSRIKLDHRQLLQVILPTHKIIGRFDPAIVPTFDHPVPAHAAQMFVVHP